MMHESFLAFQKRRYLWLSAAITGAAIALYWLHDPQEPANGGTALGYALGTVAALMIAWLAYFGVRKRQYASTLGSVRGWLSAHVYLGVAVLLIALLHSGFQYGFNVHTLALVLLALVIVSGIFGVFVYLKYPGKLSDNRGGANRAELLDQLADIDNRCRRVAKSLGDEYDELVSSAISRTQLGTTMAARLRGVDASQVLVRSQGELKVTSNAGQEAMLDWLAERQSRSADPKVAGMIGELSALIRNKRKLVMQLKEDARMQALLEVWLYVHVPLSAALLVALLVHITTVFLYW